MSVYSISDLEKLSGIKAHTIRMWEQRYEILKPLRSEGNVRYYDDDQVRQFIQIALLVRSGYKISKISKLDHTAIYKMVEDLSATITDDIKTKHLVDRLISSAIDFNEHSFQRIFQESIDHYGIITTYEKVIYPMLVKIGLLWGKTELIPAQEHFISNLIKQKLYHSIDTLPPASNGSKTWLLFLPEEEDHELGLLLSSYILRANNYRVIYLGQRVPYYNLKTVVEKIKPDYMQYFIVRYQSTEIIQEFMSSMNNDFPEIIKCISMSEKLSQSLQLPMDHRYIKDIDHLLELIQSDKA
ncbi:MerR family transcriptional regulator [Sporocytophaga myxococcoides]|uniref:MerR family transcriptional regulator n=1 Tax=Sporocytophaga myxococcoides TaxID=153721 RepID=A0A098LLC4_9BACT|nr:MerR family transcriptional regulator [Sporocytophaga myxococcoides]GAL87269.1 MerR family transcriptional regulator [Sporocytophaga myxococcoides]